MFLLLSTLKNHTLLAQASSGTITGLVTDEKDATVGNAEVTVTSTDGTVRTKSATSSDGIYNVPSIPPGTYTVLIQAKGFGQNKISDVGGHCWRSDEDRRRPDGWHRDGSGDRHQ